MKRKAIFLAALVAAVGMMAENLVILTTNDTHSNIDTDRNGVGGVLPRKAIIDSVRNAEKNVILVDAGDMVQGTLYFNFFKGDVEYPLFNMMDYDIRILGNHEFDNGLKDLAKYWKEVKGSRLSANYDFSGTEAEGIFEPYVIKEVGKKKIGFIGINVDPSSLISDYNYEGMKYIDAIATANKWASYLKKKKKCDLVVAVTHIGYSTDVDKEIDPDLAEQSRDIDIIIGGHSHTFVDPQTPEKMPYWFKNASGKPVLVTQTGKYGKNVGYINIDLDNLSKREYRYEYILVTDRFDKESYDKNIIRFLAPYKSAVDSVNNRVIGVSAMEMNNMERNGAFANWVADFGLNYGKSVADSIRKSGKEFPAVDMAIMNVGGIRQVMSKGDITEGQILATFPFSNNIQIIRLKGSDLISTLAVAAAKGGEAISENVRVVYENCDGEVKVNHVVIDGEEMDPEKYYVVSTIDYVANGNDGLKGMANHELLWNDGSIMNKRVLQYIDRHTALELPIMSDPNGRFIKLK